MRFREPRPGPRPRIGAGVFQRFASGGTAPREATGDPRGVRPALPDHVPAALPSQPEGAL